MPLQQITPILRIFDLAKAKEFYLDYLGFTIDWEHGVEQNLPRYLQISKDGCVLHLSEHYGDGAPGVAIRIAATQLEEYHQELSAKSYIFANPGLETAPWGDKECRITDPFGNRLNFYEAA